MKTLKFGFLALAFLSFGATAQVSGGGVSGGGVSGGGVSGGGISGISGGLAIDFAGSQVSGATTTKRDGGLATSLDAAFDDAAKKKSTPEPKK